MSSFEDIIKNSSAYKELQERMKDAPEALRKDAEAELEETLKLSAYYEKVFADPEEKYINEARAKKSFVFHAKTYDVSFNPKVNSDYYQLLIDYVMGKPLTGELVRSAKPGLEKSVFVYGNVGSGKSLGMYAIGKIRHVPNPVLGRFVSENQILNDCRMDKPLFQTYREHNLIIDDLGTNAGSVNVDIMKGLLEDRYLLFKREGCKTHMTTNLKPAELNEVYGHRLYDRLREMCNLIIVKGESLRK